jgi:hypothetical protein
VQLNSNPRMYAHGPHLGDFQDEIRVDVIAQTLHPLPPSKEQHLQRPHAVRAGVGDGRRAGDVDEGLKPCSHIFRLTRGLITAIDVVASVGGSTHKEAIKRKRLETVDELLTQEHS